jgi:hypothetical protein
MRTKKQVETQGKLVKTELEKYFPGSTWEIDIWDNLEWCLAVRCGTIGVYCHYREFDNHKCYSLSCSDEIGKNTGTSIEWSLGKNVDTLPEVKDLILKQIEIIKEDIEQRTKILNYNIEEIKIN